jgi:3-hydroxymyristoyl/3-hydroxydecanoyl-(acyl carrier protein) dehydratase
MFAAHRLDMRSARRSDAGTPPCSTILSLRQTPYARPLPLDYSKMTGDHSKAVLREISPQLCAGHFPLYPAMPIALLMHGLSTLCGGMLGAQAGAEVPYTVERAEVSAERLAFAGESLTFEARRVDEDAERTTFEASATLHSGETAGEMRLFTQRL